MYEAHYKFVERPFSVQPDPAFLYFSPGHKMASAMLEYGVMHRGGFTVITGEVGAGKTTLIRHLLTRIPEATRIGLITSTPRNETELLPRIMLAFDQPFEGISGIGLYKRFQEFLIDEYAKGAGAILIVDEAQNLGPERLEELRMLSNINSGKDQLLQLVIVGQPQLRDMLQNPDMLQFCQRISADYHIRPLEGSETHAYIEHRLKVAGGNPRLFSRLAKQLIFQASRGVPRVINVICDTSLVYGFAMEAREIGTHIVHQVLTDKQQHGISPIGDYRLRPFRRTVEDQVPAVPGSAVQPPGPVVKLPLADKAQPSMLTPPNQMQRVQSPVAKPIATPESPSAAPEYFITSAKLEQDDKRAPPIRIAVEETKTFRPADGRVRNHIAEKAKPVRRHGYGWLIAAVLLFALVASLAGYDVSMNGRLSLASLGSIFASIYDNKYLYLNF